MCCVVLAPLWIVVLFGRGLWTPDEPREADIVWRMSQQSDRAIPQLAGEHFLEKPPLTYWAGAVAAALAPHRDAAMRAPNLVYAVIATVALVFLAYEAGGTVVAWVSALVWATFALGLQVSAWLATDAAMVSGTTVSLLGFFCGMRAPAGRRKLAWYTLMYAGLTVAFMSKGPGAWLVPALAGAAFLVWERRWSELRRWEMWAGIVVPLCAISAWVVSVARAPDGRHALTVLLWDNVAGRALRLHDAAANAYAEGHRNWPGKYLVELPLYVLPWTLLLVAAGRRARHAVREDSGSAWRFALCVLIPPIVALSLATTARGIYAAPLLPGAALLIGLWAREVAAGSVGTFDRRMMRGTRGLVVLLTVLLFGAATVLASTDAEDARAWALVPGIAATVLALGVGSRALAQARWSQAMIAVFTAYCAGVTAVALAIFPVLDRWQDLGALMRAIGHDAGDRSIALYAPDETLTAIADRAFSAPGRPVAHVDSVAEGRRLLTGPNPPVLIVSLPGHGDGAMTRRLRSWGIHVRPPPLTTHAEQLAQELGLTLEHVYELPQGRRYALLTQPEPASSVVSSTR